MQYKESRGPPSPPVFFCLFYFYLFFLFSIDSSLASSLATDYYSSSSSSGKFSEKALLVCFLLYTTSFLVNLLYTYFFWVLSLKKTVCFWSVWSHPDQTVHVSLQLIRSDTTRHRWFLTVTQLQNTSIFFGGYFSSFRRPINNLSSVWNFTVLEKNKNKNGKIDVCQRWVSQWSSSSFFIFCFS